MSVHQHPWVFTLLMDLRLTLELRTELVSFRVGSVRVGSRGPSGPGREGGGDFRRTPQSLSDRSVSQQPRLHLLRVGPKLGAAPAAWPLAQSEVPTRVPGGVQDPGPGLAPHRAPLALLSVGSPSHCPGPPGAPLPWPGGTSPSPGAPGPASHRAPSLHVKASASGCPGGGSGLPPDTPGQIFSPFRP